MLQTLCLVSGPSLHCSAAVLQTPARYFDHILHFTRQHSQPSPAQPSQDCTSVSVLSDFFRLFRLEEEATIATAVRLGTGAAAVSQYHINAPPDINGNFCFLALACALHCTAWRAAAGALTARGEAGGLVAGVMPHPNIRVRIDTLTLLV